MDRHRIYQDKVAINNRDVQAYMPRFGDTYTDTRRAYTLLKR